MRNSARAVILCDGKVLTMFRRKISNGEKREYYVLPGGGIEEGETREETVVRELKEEMTVDIEILGYLGTDKSERGDASYYHCQIKDNAQPKLGGEEVDRMSEENYYEPRFVKLEDIDSIDIIGREFIVKAMNKQYE